MELAKGGLVKSDFIGFFGMEMNRNSVHPIVLTFIFTFFGLISITDINYKKTFLYHSFITLSIVTLLLSNSRVALACSLLVFAIHFFHERGVSKKFILITLVILLSSISIFMLDLTFLLNRFSQGGDNSGLDSSRFVMWTCYYDKFSASQILLGLHQGGDDSCAFVKGVIGKNPHNSIIWSASVYGFITIFIILNLLKNLFLNLYYRNLSLFFIYTTYLFAMNFERAYLVSPIDVVALILIFMPRLKSVYAKNSTHSSYT
ncbi:hypothetical protein EO763_07395 [Pectobacterium odoriferum]|uniref:hypothetical protein n=1 Tax=Pectobacterium odoriferum TaxID=78398 RepID=UPI0013744DDB|nr:hypothetical protein [Pectobacterium odoriferum]QHP79774.1 hypothetical protein EO763_07395 [Pectobacterium odoriferum]